MSNHSDSTTSHSTHGHDVTHETKSTEKVVWPWRTLILVALIVALVIGALVGAGCFLYHHFDDDGPQTIVHVQPDDCENVTVARLTGECPEQTPAAVEAENNAPLGTFEIPSRSVEQGILRPFYWPTDSEGGDTDR